MKKTTQTDPTILLAGALIILILALTSCTRYGCPTTDKQYWYHKETSMRW